MYPLNIVVTSFDLLDFSGSCDRSYHQVLTSSRMNQRFKKWNESIPKFFSPKIRLTSPTWRARK